MKELNILGKKKKLHCKINIIISIKSNAHLMLTKNKKWHCIRTLKRNLHCLCLFYKACQDIYLLSKV